MKKFSDIRTLPEFSDLNRVWRHVPSLHGYYASSLGEIASCRGPKPRILKTAKSKRGASMVSVSMGTHDLSTTIAVHTLVLLAFVGPKPTRQHEARHIDNDQSNCRPSNLEWRTKAEIWRLTDRLRTLNHGCRNHSTKLTAESVAQIRLRVANGESRTALAIEFGVARSTISDIINQITWNHDHADTTKVRLRARSRYRFDGPVRARAQELRRSGRTIKDIAFMLSSEHPGPTGAWTQYAVRIMLES